MIRIGTAGWTIPPPVAADFPGEGPHLARYSRRLAAAEINSSFHRQHRPATYARWAATVPEGFVFAVKLPRTITHDAKLHNTGDLLREFAEQVRGLGDRLAVLLMQLPPKLAFDAAVTDAFLNTAREILPAPLCCEPRHASWFEDAADRLLAEHRVARVAADPARVPQAAVPGGFAGRAYWRLHGSPHTYYSGYGADRLRSWADAIGANAAPERWCILDNTARGEAAADALLLTEMLADL